MLIVLLTVNTFVNNLTTCPKVLILSISTNYPLINLMDRSTIPTYKFCYTPHVYGSLSITCLTVWDINVFIKMLTFAVCPHCIITKVIRGKNVLHSTRSLHSNDVINILHSMGIIGGQTTLHSVGS